MSADSAASSSFSRQRELFLDLVELSAPEREQRLGEAAARDPELAAAVRGLLAADADAEEFLSRPAGEMAPTLVGEWLEGGGESAEGTRIGPYRLLGLLGRGGMGEVYLAERCDGQFEQQVAIKWLRRGVGGEAAQRRFLQERQILARLEHPHIARLLDGGLTADGRPYFVLERVSGQPITTWCEVHKPSLEVRLQLIATACDAVALAHRNLIVHRDLKPSNILVDEAGQVKLLDFGIAKLLQESDDPTLTRLDERILTPSYAAPEQILGEPVTTATDVYALGAVLFELLTGARPHASPLTASLAAQRDEEVTRPSTAVRRRAELADDAGDQHVAQELRKLGRSLSGDLDNILMTALRNEAERRYPSAAALAADLRRFLAGRTVQARPDTSGYRLRKFIQRHRVGVATASLAAVAVLAGLGVALDQARAARQAAAEAQVQAARADRVRAFMVSLLREADPFRREQGREPTLRELIHRGVEKAERELADEPEALGQACADLALLASNLGDWAGAVRYGERSLAARRQALPAMDLKIAESLQALVLPRLNTKDFAGAEAAAREALAIAAATQAPDSEELDDHRLSLVLVYSHLHRADLALPLYRELLDNARRRYGEDHPSTGIAYLNVSEGAYGAGAWAEGEAAARKALEIFTAAHGPEHLRVAYAGINLGSMLASLGRDAEAVATLQRALEIATPLLGRQHTIVSATQVALAPALARQGNVGDAEARLRGAAAALAAEANPGEAEARLELARLLLDQNRSREAQPELDRALQVATEIAQDRPGGAASARAWRAYGAFHAGAPAAAALVEVTAAEEALRQAPDRAPESLLWVLAQRAELLAALGRGAEALHALADAEAQAATLMAADHWFRRRLADLRSEVPADSVGSDKIGR